MSFFDTNLVPKLDTEKFCLSDKSLLIRNMDLPPNVMTFNSNQGEVARIDADGIMRFTIDANDENAANFIACIETCIGRRVTGIVVDSKNLQPT